MFGKLKEAAGNGAVQKLIDMAAPGLKDQLIENLNKVNPDAVKHDESYEEKVINPLNLTVSASSSGATKLIPGFDSKFKVAMLHLRDELIDATGDSVKLVEGFDKKLPDVLKSGFEKAKAAS